MPIFMIGTRRSGSNLLRVMLNQLPDVAAPHPPHIILRLMPLHERYGDLQDDGNFAMLVDDACRIVESNPVAWEGVKLDRSEVAHRCRDRSVVAVAGALYDIAASASGKQDWCCKSLENVYFLNDIERYYPGEAKYLYLYRDGRDVAVSTRKAIVGEKHYYFIAQEWAAMQRLAIECRDRIGPSRFMGVSYEDITGRPEPTTRALCKFLGQPFTPEMLDFHKGDEAKRAAESSALWGNVTRPLMKDNTRKFLRECSPDELKIFEGVAGDVLDALGYERVATKPGERLTFGEDEIRVFAEENARLKAEILKTLPPDDQERRDRQDAVLAQIKARLGEDTVAKRA
jgi:hypothetical protein